MSRERTHHANSTSVCTGTKQPPTDLTAGARRAVGQMALVPATTLETEACCGIIAYMATGAAQTANVRYRDLTLINTLPKV